MQEESLRNLAADSMAQGFIVEILLVQYLKKFPPAERQEIVSSLLNAGKRTDHFFGIAKDDLTAEEFSDVVVRMHGALDGLVARALSRIVARPEPSGDQTPQS